MVRRRLRYTTALTTLFSYGLLFAFGQLRDFFRNLIDCFKPNNAVVKVIAGRDPPGRRQR
jgi:serine palmitoyltransferase